MAHPLPLAGSEHVSNEFEGVEDFQDHEGVVASVHLVICVIFS